jgi:hypothetical protein
MEKHSIKTTAVTFLVVSLVGLILSFGAANAADPDQDPGTPAVDVQGD